MSEPETDETAPPAPGATVEVPSFLADAVRIAISPFTLHVQLGSSLIDGTVRTRAVVAMSPAFARHLQQALGEAIEVAEKVAKTELGPPSSVTET